MPSTPRNTKCQFLGCRAVAVLGGYCDAHKTQSRPKEITQDRKDSNARYNKADWGRMRQAQLSIQPLCQCCYNKGRIVQGEHIDHVFPWRVIGGDCFTRSPLQTLCANCHRLKTWLERKGIFRHYLEGRSVDYRAMDYLTLPDRRIP